MFAQLLANGLVTGSVIAIAAVGVSIVYGILRLVNFAYGDFMAFGALAAYAFNGPLKLDLVLSAILAMVATAALSLLLDATLWRPRHRIHVDSVRDARRDRRHPRRACTDDVRPELRLPAPPPHLRRGRPRRDRQRLRRAGGWPDARHRDGALNLALLLRRREP